MTIKDYAKQNAKVLDARFHEKYPNGKFVVQVLLSNISLHWTNKRNTSWTTHIGISNTQRASSKQIVDQYFQGSSRGKVYLYTNLEDAIKKAKKLNFPEEFINRFVERYNNREDLIKKYNRKEHVQYLKSINYGLP